MSKNILLLAVIAGGVYWYSNRNKETTNNNRGSGYAYDTTQEVKLNRATDGSGRYQLPIDIIKRGGPTTTEFDTIYRAPTQFSFGIIPYANPKAYMM